MADAVHKIDIATQFSRFPAGRYLADGPFSGQAFRDTLLVPALRSGKRVRVILDGTAGFGSSFLEETFGGLVRAGWKIEELLQKLDFVSSDPSLLEEIESYIKNAGNVDDVRV